MPWSPTLAAWSVGVHAFLQTDKKPSSGPACSHPCVHRDVWWLRHLLYRIRAFFPHTLLLSLTSGLGAPCRSPGSPISLSPTCLHFMLCSGAGWGSAPCTCALVCWCLYLWDRRSGMELPGQRVLHSYFFLAVLSLASRSSQLLAWPGAGCGHNVLLSVVTPFTEGLVVCLCLTVTLEWPPSAPDY